MPPDEEAEEIDVGETGVLCLWNTGAPWRSCSLGSTPLQESECHNKVSQMNVFVSGAYES